MHEREGSSPESRGREYLSAQGIERVGLIKDAGRHQVFEGIKDGREVIVKLVEAGKPDAELIRNQSIAQNFLRAELSESGLIIPEGTYSEDGGFAALIMNRISGETYADGKPDGMKHEVTEAEEDALIRFLIDARKIPAEKIPSHFSATAREVWNDAFYDARMDANAKGPIERGFLSATDFAKLKDLWRTNLAPKTFQHHDVVPFNLLKTPEGKMALIDGEFARLGMPGYDAAYYVIQMSTLLNRPVEGERFLNKFLETWEKQFPEDQMRQAICSPFAYRFVANLADPGMTDDGVRERSQELGERFLSGKLLASS